jgi:hypothetical protein
LGGIGFLGELLDMTAVSVLARLPWTRATWHKASVRIVQNRETLACLPEPLRAGAIVLNHAVFTEVQGRVSSPRGQHCLLVGALESRKGAVLAIHALASTPEDITLMVVGDGPERRRLERLARRLRVSHRVHFCGHASRERVGEYLAGAAAVVFTGLREEGGIALAEAMLAGSPVIVLANGGALTVAGSTTDPGRVALVPPGTITATAARIGEAMTRFVRHPVTATGPMLDQTASINVLKQLLAQQLPRRPSAARDISG